jgi:peptidyl-dipeptidase Dcp
MTVVAEETEAAVEQTAFGPQSPFYAVSTLPYEAPPFDRIVDADYLPAIEAGMAEHLREIVAIADNSAEPTFENTLVALEKSGALLSRAYAAFAAVAGTNTNAALERVEEIAAPKLAAHADAMLLNQRLFARIESVYRRRESLALDAESLRLLDLYYQRFLHAGASLSDADKQTLRALNEELSTLQNRFRAKVMAATRDASFATTDAAQLRGLGEAHLGAAAETARSRGLTGWVLAMQNTTQQPVLAALEDRATRQAVFAASWGRAERGDANDTRETVARIVTLRAEKAELLGATSFAAWKLEDQMAGTPDAAAKFLDALAPAATVKVRDEAAAIQALIDAQGGAFAVEPWDWDFYAEQVRKARYDLDEAAVQPYFEAGRVLRDGVFFAAEQLYGLGFRQRHDIPVYHPEVEVFEIFEASGEPLALFYCDLFKRDNKRGGAWMSNFVGQSKLLGTRAAIYNVCNFPRPTPGEPALISFSDVMTMFHEFGHALHGMFSDVTYPELSGTAVPRDFVEFPSQFNEYWATDPAAFDRYARHHATGGPMPAELAAKLRLAEEFNRGYTKTEVLAAANLDLQWHMLSAAAASEIQPNAFEREALERKGLALREVPPRYRSSYFQHSFAGGYAAGYYAYLWAERLEHEAIEWFKQHGGLTRANGDRLRRMILSRGNTEELGGLFAAWIGE